MEMNQSNLLKLEASSRAAVQPKLSLLHSFPIITVKLLWRREGKQRLTEGTFKM